MSFNPNIETPLTLSEAERDPAALGRSRWSLWRYATRGVTTNGQRVRLEVLKAGRRYVTSREALRRFYTKLAEASRERFDAADAIQTPAETSARHRAAMRELEAAGI